MIKQSNDQLSTIWISEYPTISCRGTIRVHNNQQQDVSCHHRDPYCDPSLLWAQHLYYELPIHIVSWTSLLWASHPYREVPSDNDDSTVPEMIYSIVLTQYSFYILPERCSLSWILWQDWITIRNPQLHMCTSHRNTISQKCFISNNYFAEYFVHCKNFGVSPSIFICIYVHKRWLYVL